MMKNAMPTERLLPQANEETAYMVSELEIYTRLPRTEVLAQKMVAFSSKFIGASIPACGIDQKKKRT